MVIMKHILGKLSIVDFCLENPMKNISSIDEPQVKYNLSRLQYYALQ
jgi:hypothetical protein